ncbi:MAG TPA: hypothetical protein VMS64_02430 [Candidatus Methylomirabilis sp.]|nr:hypothetical protein [Candidatus Methylomirabilis sp.]
MTAVSVLGVWLTPVLWLSMPMLIVARGTDGLWIALVLVLAPLVALGIRPSPRGSAMPESGYPVVVLVATVVFLFWANMILAGDVAAWLGVPRWHGIAVTVVSGCLVTAWRGARRLVPVLLLVAMLAVSGPLAELSRTAGTGPLGAWARVAAQPAFRFPASSLWVTRGLPFASMSDREPIRFDEEHRITVPSGGRLVARTADGGRADSLDLTLAAGQSVVFRPGDRLQSTSAPRVQFEPDKRVPGSPVSGVAWATGRPPDWPRSAGLAVTLLFAALALCYAGRPVRASRATVAAITVGGVVAFLWAQVWAVYALLVSPDVLLGAVTPDRLLALPSLRDDLVGTWLQSLLIVGGLGSFLASSIVLRERLATLDATGGGEIGRDLGLWTGVFASAGLAAVWRLDCWSLALLGLGAAASGLGAIMLGGDAVAPPPMAAFAGSVGLAVFSALAVIDHIRPGTDGPLGALFAYPALAAVPAAFLTLRVCRAVASR